LRVQPRTVSTIATPPPAPLPAAAAAAAAPLLAPLLPLAGLLPLCEDECLKLDGTGEALTDVLAEAALKADCAPREAGCCSCSSAGRDAAETPPGDVPAAVLAAVAALRADGGAGCCCCLLPLPLAVAAAAAAAAAVVAAQA
jgi:hypothetical protein